jgi:ribosomal-protein-alanine N-acetyltransferase
MERFEAHKEPHISMEEASEADMDALIDIEKSVPKTNAYSPMLTERGWERELAENTVYLIKSGDIPVGSIAYAEKSPEHVYISGVIVRPEYQGRGIATNAIKEVLEKYPNASRIDLVTHPENPALGLYESLGFKVEERKENYFGDGEPRLVLALTKD